MTQSPRWALIALFLVAAGVAAGCAPRTKPSAVSAESHAPGTTLAKTPADCSAYPIGSAGVIRTFCTGSAKVVLTIDGVDHPLKGGGCAATGGGFSLNLGVVSGPDLAGPKPDFVGLSTAVANGPFTGATIAVTLNGQVYKIIQNSGSVSPAGGAFQGVGSNGGPAIKGSFTC